MTFDKEELGRLHRCLREALEKPEVHRDTFCEYFDWFCETLDVSDNTMAKYLQISRPTVKRCRHDEAAPHNLGRIPILRAMCNVAGFELSKL